MPHLIIKVAGLFANYFIPNHYGKAVAEVFKVINDSVLNVAFLIGEQCLAPSYLPLFSKAKAEGGEKRAWRYTSILFNLQFVALLVAVALFVLFPETFVNWLTDWKAGDLPEKVKRREIFLKMLPFAAPGLIGMSLASLTYVVLNGYKEFFYAAFGDAILKLSIVGGAAAGYLLKSGDWRFVAGGAVVGGTLKLATHLVALGIQRLRNYTFSWDISDPYVKAFFMLVLPLFAGVLVSQGRDQIITKVLTKGADLKLYFSQGRNVVDTIQFIVPYTLSIAMLPFFCDLAARQDNQRLGAVLTQIIRMLVWVFVPISVALFAAAMPLSQALYEGEKFNGADIVFSAHVSKLFALQLPFAAIEIMTMQAFFSSKRMIAPTLAGFFFSALSAGTSYYCVMNDVVTSPQAVLTLVALSLIVARALKSVILVGLLSRSIPVLPLGETLVFGVRLLIAGGAAAAMAFAVSTTHLGDMRPAFLQKILGDKWLGKGMELTHAGLIAALTLGTFVAFSLLLRMEEPAEFKRWTLEKLKRRK